MLSHLFYFINSHTQFLYTVLYKNTYFFIDIWSFVHVISGLLFMSLFDRGRCRRPLPLLLAVLIFWELLEISFIYFAVGIFKPETIPDQCTDILVGAAGGLLSRALMAARNGLQERRPLIPEAEEIFVACFMSLLWVGFYGYRYNVPYFNSPGVNWLTFILWSGGLLITLRLYGFYSSTLKKPWLRLPVLWITYFAGLLAVEYFGYRIAGVRLITDEKPLVFGLIHGTLLLKLYYLFAGLAAVAFTRLIKIIFSSLWYPPQFLGAKVRAKEG